jgi:UDP-N-acetylmuramate: L-alanyl-gamma-D-glutamyl-meso-diaminopimelate ligase
MRLHILGICGTFMGGIAALARELGHEVEGSDQNIYPPMSDQLAALGITLKSGYLPEHLGAGADSAAAPDLVIVGNALSRGNPAIEYMLNAGLPFVSGPQWIGDQLLANRRVFAVAGTHGKTTTTAMLAWILDASGQAPGFLVGGVPENFGVSARLGNSGSSGPAAPFVIEADEYDTAYFDKRSKFVHYHADIAILNNLEYDHADIYPDLA